MSKKRETKAHRDSRIKTWIIRAVQDEVNFIMGPNELEKKLDSRIRAVLDERDSELLDAQKELANRIDNTWHQLDKLEAERNGESVVTAPIAKPTQIPSVNHFCDVYPGQCATCGHDPVTCPKARQSMVIGLPCNDWKAKPAPEPVNGKWAVVVKADMKLFWYSDKIGKAFKIIREGLYGEGAWVVESAGNEVTILKSDCYPVLLDAPLPEIPAKVWETKSPEEWEEWIKKDDGHEGYRGCGHGHQNCLVNIGQYACVSNGGNRLKGMVDTALAAIAVEKAKRAKQTPINQPDPPKSHDPADWVHEELHKDRARLDFWLQFPGKCFRTREALDAAMKEKP